MKVLIIGKYPPIEGGVSAHTYWLARGLGEMGIQTAVVTNAGRVEEQYRQNLTLYNDEENTSRTDHVSEYQPKNVTVFSLEDAPPTHIPYSEGYVTRLVNLALKAIEVHGADVIYAHYLEPYAFAGYIVKQMTGLPLVVRHAGSDIYRMLRSPDYAYALGRMLKDADAFFMPNQLQGIAQHLGIEHKRHLTPKRSLPSQFNPHDTKLTLPAHWEKPNDVPLLTYLGKTSNLKGLNELLSALERLQGDFRMLFVSKGPLLAEIKERVNGSEKLKERVWFSDFVAPWIVPKILRATDYLIHLENRFSVPIHSPAQPLEAVASQTPLLLSGEMFKKIKPQFPQTHQLFSVVEDPQDIDSLTAILEEMLQNVNAKKENAVQIYNEFAPHNNWEKHVSDYLNVLESVQKKGIKRFWPF